MTSTSNSETSKKSKPPKAKTNEEILIGFQKLRNEQRFLTNKMSELELELHEHRIVLDALKDLDGDRKCFRMIGGVLCERTVKDVIPVLKTNEANLTKVVDVLVKQILMKGTEINKYKDEHNVKFKHVDEFNEVSDNENKSTSSGGASTGGSGTGGGGGVLVS